MTDNYAKHLIREAVEEISRKHGHRTDKLSIFDTVQLLDLQTIDLIAVAPTNDDRFDFEEILDLSQQIGRDNCTPTVMQMPYFESDGKADNFLAYTCIIYQWLNLINYLNI